MVESAEACATLVESAEACAAEARSAEACTAEVRSAEACTPDISLAEACTAGVRSVGACTAHVKSTEACTPDVKSAEACTAKSNQPQLVRQKLQRDVRCDSIYRTGSGKQMKGRIIALGHSSTRLTGSKRNRRGTQGADTSSGRRQGWIASRAVE